MNERIIHIVSAPKHSGKTTKLMAWSIHQQHVYGILSPIVNGERIFMDVHTKEQFALEANLESKNVYAIGKYVFSVAAFNRAAAIILQSMDCPARYLIIDEVGPLELMNKGFANVINTLLDMPANGVEIIFVIREGMVESVATFFNLNRFRVEPMVL